MKNIIIIYVILYFAGICLADDKKPDRTLQFEYYYNEEIPDKYVKSDYENTMKKPALLSYLQLAMIGMWSHDEYISFTRGIMLRLPMQDRDAYGFEEDYMQKARNMLLRMDCHPQKKCEGLCMFAFDEACESKYDKNEIAILQYYQSLVKEINWSLYLRLPDSIDENLYDNAIEYSLHRIVEYIKSLKRGPVTADKQEKISIIRHSMQRIVTRMSIRQLFESTFMTQEEKRLAWYFVKDSNEKQLTDLIFESAFEWSEGVNTYACPASWKQQAEKWSAELMAENWYREIRQIYSSECE